MIRVLPEVVEVVDWTLVFHRSAAARWVERLACGRYKHVSAFAWVRELRVWVIYDVKLSGSPILLLPDSQAALDRLAEHTCGADLMRMPRRAGGGFAFGFFCVPAIKHLVGLRGGALRPDALWRDCLRQGGKVVDGSESANATSRSADRLASATG